MPFDASLPDEPVSDGAKALRCKYVDRLTNRRCVWMYDHEDQRHHNGSWTWMEPLDSASSSPDELCLCGHPRSAHNPAADAGCARCAPFSMAKHSFDQAPAEPDPMRPQLAGAKMTPRPAQPEGCDGCSHASHRPDPCGAEGCFCGHDVPEPEALEEPVCSNCEGTDPQTCFVCGEREQNRLEMEAIAPPRRPPYAVAYATEDGTQFEVALPGDATVRALDGALVITHGSAVQALIQIRPMEGA